MGYGGLDRALSYRLENLGVRGKQVRHRAVCIHLHHERRYRKPEVVQANRAAWTASAGGARFALSTASSSFTHRRLCEREHA